MSKLAKAAIICTVIFLVFSIASTVLFVMAAPEIPRYTEEINKEIEQWRESIENTFPGFEGWVYDEDGYFEFYWNGEHFEFRGGDKDWAEKWALPSAPEEPEEPETPASSDSVPPVSPGT